MMIYLNANNDEMCEIIEEEYSIPMKKYIYKDGNDVPKLKKDWSQDKKKRSNLHVKLKKKMVCSMTPKEFKSYLNS